VCACHRAERAWLLRAEAGREIPAATAGGRIWPGLVLDLDATLITFHSERNRHSPPKLGARVWQSTHDVPIPDTGHTRDMTMRSGAPLIGGQRSASCASIGR
jgi:hypothetical protein